MFFSISNTLNGRLDDASNIEPQFKVLQDTQQDRYSECIDNCFDMDLCGSGERVKFSQALDFHFQRKENWNKTETCK